MKTIREREPNRAFSSFLFFIILFAPTFKQAFAQGQQTERLLKMTYDTGDYQATASLASDMISRQPNNSFAYYYLGSAMARSGRADEARKALTKCLSLSRGTDLGKQAQRSLTELLPYDVRPDKNRAEPQLSSTDSKERQRLLSEQEREMKAAEKRFDENINRLQKSISPEELKLATQKEYEQLSKEQASITERYQRRADALLRRGSTPSSAGPELAPLSSNSSYVQNYVHSGDPSQAASIPTENPRQARALKLGETEKKATTVRTTGKRQSGGK